MLEKWSKQEERRQEEWERGVEDGRGKGEKHKQDAFRATPCLVVPSSPASERAEKAFILPASMPLPLPFLLSFPLLNTFL